MNPVLESLSDAVEAKNEQKIIDNLQEILTQPISLELENNNLAKRIIALNNPKTRKSLVEVIAEWCKLDHNRKVFTDKAIIEFLFELLDCQEDELTVSAIRALGNICYENDEARKIIDKKGLATVVTILENDKNRKGSSLTLKASGFLVNLLMSNEELQKAALKYNIIEIIEKLLNKYVGSYSENQMLITFLLTILNNVVDFAEELNIPFPESLCCILIDIFKLSTTPEVSVSCLEILHGQSDKDEVKTLLATRGTCELVFDLIEKYQSEVKDEETRSVMKMACDLIVIILTGGDCMSLLYNNGKGKVYEDMISWLDSSDPDLLSTGVLAVGNFARKDAHCIQLVQNGISKKLIELLSKYNTSESDIKVQHALLSTLKNLVIPKPNKARIIEEGLIDVIYPMININQPLVIFKLLGTFRMVIDGQDAVALDLLLRPGFVEKLIHWCYTSDHLGVRGEVPRLISWLIKHCHSFKPLNRLIRIENTIKCLVEMTSSNHAVMQNESFYALNLLCVGCAQAQREVVNGDETHHEGLFEQLVEADVGKNLHFVIGKYGEKMDSHTVDNLVTLLEQLVRSPLVVDHLKAAKMQEVLEKLAASPNAQSAGERLKKVEERLRN